MLQSCKQMQYLGISGLGMPEKDCKLLVAFLVKLWAKDWNLRGSLRHLAWSEDLSEKQATDFLCKQLPKVYNMRLKSLEMTGCLSKQ